MPVYEFQCPYGHIFDRWCTSNRTRRVACQRQHSDLRRVDDDKQVWAKRILSATPGIVKNPAVPRRGK